MAMMAKMRSLAPAFILGAGVIFVLFMVVSSSDIMAVFGAHSNIIGSVNGEKITYQEFNKFEDQERQAEEQRTGKDPSANDPAQFRDQVWNALITQKLFQQEMDKFGIRVTDQEIKDVILSNDPPQFLKQDFIDSTGKFNRDMYLNAIYDPRNSKALIQAEDYIRQSLLSQKLQSILDASITVSENEVKRRFIEQNTKIDAQYALVGLNEFPDSTIKINEDDLKDYYNSHNDQYKVVAQRKLKYVLFRNEPSHEDSALVQSDLENAKDEIASSDTTTFKSLADQNPDLTYGKVDTVDISSLPAEASDKIYHGKPGEMIGPILSREGCVLYHLIAVVPSKSEEVRASHILINQYGSDQKNLEEAIKIYKKLQNGADFATLAEQYSQDPGSARKGGDVGWFGKGRMVPEFEKAAFSGAVGVVQKPVKTSYGYHIIKVTGKTDKKFVIEKLFEPIKASVTTQDANLNEAKDFAYIANKDGFEKEAKLMKYSMAQTPPFTKDAYAIPGIGLNNELRDWAFNNDLNDISEVYRVASGYVVTQISDIVNAGVKPFDQVKAQIRPLVLRENKFALAKTEAEKIKSQINGDLSKASSIDSKVVINVTGQFTPAGSVPTVGVDYAFIDKCLDLDVNKVSEPVKGIRGYYLIKIISKTPFDSTAFEAQSTTIRNSILQQEQSTFFNEWLSELRKNADIVDNRRQFFGI
jgi:peptidyl-prolyl cis-trans isomerase D